MLEFLNPYLGWIRVASYALMFLAGWTVNGWRYDAASATADSKASDAKVESVEEARSADRQSAADAGAVDRNHADRQDEINGEAKKNDDLVGGITAAADRVLGSRNPSSGNLVPGSPRGPGDVAARSPDRDRANRCEALLAEGIGLVAEGGRLIAGTAERHDEAASYAISGHEWAVKVGGTGQPGSNP